MKEQILNEDGTINFEKFNQLDESKQIQLMEKWTPQQWMEYCMQNTISEEECFAPVFELIKEIEDMENENGEINYCVDESPKFNTIEELRAYYNCIPLEDVMKSFDKVFEVAQAGCSMEEIEKSISAMKDELDYKFNNSNEQGSEDIGVSITNDLRQKYKRYIK